MKRVLSLTVTVESRRQINGVHHPDIHKKPDAGFVPIHSPDMELIGPLRIVEILEGRANQIPLGHSVAFGAPGRVSHEQSAIILHNVDFTAVGPLALDPKGPEGRPEPRASINPSSHFETAILPAMQPFGRKTGGGVLGILPFFPPILAVRFVVWVWLALGAALDHQQAVLAAGVVGLVPLVFLCSDETSFVGPIPRGRRGVFSKLIGPNQFPAL